MAQYKVPQDVEADDKLIGPFSFRQFIYLIIVALAIAMAWGLAQLFIGLVIIPLPIVIFFGALALPLRKDQPMEIYLAAIVSFYLKPRKRMWDPDGIDSLIEITVPKVVTNQLTKDISQADAEQRFSYLANIVDSQGWAIRGGTPQTVNTAVNPDLYLEAQGATDVLDASSSVGQSFNTMMSQETDRVRQEAINHMYAPAADPTSDVGTAIQPTYNPYPTSIQQSVVQPVDDDAHRYVDPSIIQPAQTPATTSDKPVSTGIMDLANNTDLSIETIAREAHRIQQKEDDMNEEVVISLR